MFWLICLFFILHINANFFIGGQQTPFFYWSLYATPVQPQEDFYFFEVRYNGDQKILFPETWRQTQRLFYSNTLSQYVSMKNNQNKDPLKDYIDRWNSTHPLVRKIFPGLKFYSDSVEMKAFPDWYAKKIEQLTGETVHSIDIYKIAVRFLENGNVQKVSSELLYKLK